VCVCVCVFVFVRGGGEGKTIHIKANTHKVRQNNLCVSFNKTKKK
jgi:hypothetical protein